jgi:hypothetical protein
MTFGNWALVVQFETHLQRTGNAFPSVPALFDADLHLLAAAIVDRTTYVIVDGTLEAAQ